MSDRGRSPERSGPPGSNRGPSTSPTRSSRPGSSAGPPAGSVSGGQRPPSPTRSSGSGQQPQQPQGQWIQGMGRDPAKPAEKFINKRVELPADAFTSNKEVFAVREKKMNTEGSNIVVDVNQFRLKKLDFSKKIHQYEVILEPPPPKGKAAIIKKIRTHPTFRQALAPYDPNFWIFDHANLAWAPVPVERGEIRCIVDLDEGQANNKGNNRFKVTIRHTTELALSDLAGYLDHKVSFSNAIQEALTFLDHLIRERPSQNLLAIKRNFFNSNVGARPLMDGSVIEVHQGTYASLRTVNNLSLGGIGLGINADITNTCFWVGNQTVDRLTASFLAASDNRFRNLNPNGLAQALRPVRGSNGQAESSEAFKYLRKMRRLKFKIAKSCAGRNDYDRLYTISGFSFDPKFGPNGATAQNVSFEHEGQQITIAQYYRKKYNYIIRHANLPLIEVLGGPSKVMHFPMELAFVEPMQRYPAKLSPDQTAAMIKIAVTRPAQRRADIMRNYTGLHYATDPYLKKYGVELEAQFTKTDAKLLPTTAVNFRQGACDPKHSGRWDLRGKKFWKSNEAPLKSWGIIAMDGCCQLPILDKFAKDFRRTFLGHGGNCPDDAMVLNLPGHMSSNGADAVAWAFDQIGSKRGYPQLLFIVVRHKNSPHYERLKKSADARYGILSQVVNAGSVEKSQGQYHSNVCMKVNAKLGGATSRTTPPWNSKPNYFPTSCPTMIIGLDVAHAAPGSNAPSTAAMTMSVDPDATRYAASVETNGHRIEMLTPSNVRQFMDHLSHYWKNNHGNALPQHVIFFRDGVAEGQFAHVLEQEVTEIKKWFQEKFPKSPPPKFTVIVATKRHHVRLFPHRGDKNGNALPGTLVEKEVTHPFMWDFYLCSHVAIQGTARPVHYHVLVDEMGMTANNLQKMIYHQCYSYARSTTPVSIHPAVYYAHLASNRARAHENLATSEGFRAGKKGAEIAGDAVAKGLTVDSVAAGEESAPLLRLGGQFNPSNALPNEQRQRDFFRGTMWYI